MNEDRYIGFFYLKIFLLIVVVMVVGSVIAKVVTEIVNSNFDNNAFSVLYVAHDSKLIYVDKKDNEVLFLALGDLRKYTKGKNVLGVSFALGLPLNAVIFDDNPPQNLAEFTKPQNQMRLMFDSRPILKNMNRYDVYKLIDVPFSISIVKGVLLTDESIKFCSKSLRALKSNRLMRFSTLLSLGTFLIIFINL